MSSWSIYYSTLGKSVKFTRIETRFYLLYNSPESRPDSTSYTILVRSKTQSREKVKPPFQSNQKSSLPIHSKHTVLYSSVIFTFCTCIENVIRRDTIKQNQNYVLFSDENEALDLWLCELESIVEVFLSSPFIEVFNFGPIRMKWTRSCASQSQRPITHHHGPFGIMLLWGWF